MDSAVKPDQDEIIQYYCRQVSICDETREGQH